MVKIPHNIETDIQSLENTDIWCFNCQNDVLKMFMASLTRDDNALCSIKVEVEVEVHEWLAISLTNNINISIVGNQHDLSKSNEARHVKTNKMSVRPAKTQISLGIRLVWSESSLSA